VDDLDSQRCREHFVDSQLADLQAIGLDWDDRGAELRQSDRDAAYAAAVDKLAGQGLVYECYCSRKEIQQAASAPHQLP
ncbi:glutamate--tRNA ligase family protein, partial [Klebsiella pneumoniae]|nr:glutamate--tRNA ligase family protein [Klebsiella pneumoniae]